MADVSHVLSGFDPLVAEWFERRFGAPTEPQILGWPEIRSGQDVLISAPTGSGKTLAAFLLCLDRLVRAARGESLANRSEEHTSELQSHVNLVCRLLLEKKKKR